MRTSPLPRQPHTQLRLVLFLLALAAALVPATMRLQSPSNAAPRDDQPGSHRQARPTAYRSRAGKHKLRVTDRSIARELKERSARMIADYGGFQLFLADEQTAERFAANEFVEIRDEENLILLNAGAIDTTSDDEQQREGLDALASAAQSEPSLHLVQFAGPIRPDWHAALAATGVKIVSYIPNNAYLVYGDAQVLNRLREFASRASYVQWNGGYQNRFKLDASLREAGKGAPPSGSDLFAIQLASAGAANQPTLALINSLKTEAIRGQFSVLNYLNVIVKLPSEAVEKQLALRPDVVSIARYIEPIKFDERQDVILTANLLGTSPATADYLAYLASQGLNQSQFTASNFAINVSDSGIDNGTTTPNHFALFTNGQIASQSRVIYNRLEGAPNQDSTLEGCDGHGNLNAHIIAGFVPSSFNQFPHADGSGFRFGLGVAPFVKLGSSVIFDPNRYTFPNLVNLESRAYNDGARISSNSWGANSNGAYTIDAQAYDALVRDAQPAGSANAQPGNQQMVAVFAGGNLGPNSSSIGSPASAKNIITVGAAESVLALGGTDACNVNDAQANSANDMTDFSSRGPTQDGRTKPDLVAPGSHITGGIPQILNPALNGQANPCYAGNGICGGAGGVPYFPLGQQFYTVSSGTSHATPAAAGAAALVRQRFLNAGQSAPSPAMTKAAMMNTARYLNGVNANDALWSNTQGMGEINLTSFFDLFNSPAILRDQLPAETLTATGQTRAITGTVANPGKPFRVTLAWTDAPGSTIGNAYVNNLNLEVTAGGQTYYGNVFNGAFSATGGAADARNNVESVLLPAGASVSFVVRVIGANIAGDGVPNSGGALDQDFALVINNAFETPQAVLTSGSSSIANESCSPANGAADPGETVTVNLPLQNIGTLGTANLVATLQSSGGVINPDAPENYGALSAGGAAVSRAFTFTAGGTCGGTLTATLQLQDGANNLGTVSYNFTLGTAILNNGTFTNNAAITVPAGAPGATAGAATPYPSTITASGLTGAIGKVTVTLNNVSHSFPDDLDVLLVSPSGQKVLLMSDAGGDADLTGATLTFDDTGTAIPDTTPIATGAYSPANYGGVADAFPAPAPAGPYPDPQRLSAFNGANPNGAWSLYVVDDGDGDSGAIQGGWSLSIVTSLPACCSGVACPSIAVNPPTLMNATVGTAFSQTFTQTSGNAPVSFGISGTLPAGLQLNGATLSGLPTQSGAFSLSITAVDSMGCIGNRGYTLTVACPQINIAPPALADARTGASYNQMLTQSGGLAPVTFSVAGALPGGLSLGATTGVLSGTPSAPGTFTFTVRAADANNCFGERNYTLIVSGNGLAYYPLPRPIRLFDTRAPIPGFPACEYLDQPLVAGGELARQARITCDGITIPASAQAIVGNATIVGPSANGFATLWPDAQPRPPVSNLNYVAGQVVPNHFTVGLSSTGNFRVYSTSATHFIVDITGYYAPPGTGGLFYHPVPRPIRLFDTRAPIPGFAACEYLNQPLIADTEFAKQARITCDGIAIPADAMAIVGNATVVSPAGGGFITLWPNGQPRPPVSNLNYVAGQVAPNAFTVGLGSDGQFRTYSYAGTHFIVDVTGYYSASPADVNGAGLLYSPLTRPIRLFDTRAPIPGFDACEYLNQPLIADAELARQARITCDGVAIPASAQAIVGNATMVGPSGGGFITLWPNGQARPPVSNLNYAPGQVVPNAFTVGLGNDGQFRIYSFAGTHFIADLTGYFAP